MIFSRLGTAKLTGSSEKLVKDLNLPLTEVNDLVKDILGADLSVIFMALVKRYDEETALSMWTRTIEVYIEMKKEGEI